jgi:phosphocarrier protein HPr
MSSTCDIERAVVIANKYGLHARPAAEFVKLATQFRANIVVRKDELDVNGKSIMGIMMLAAECGSEIVIGASGEDAMEAVLALVSLVHGRFGEE